MRAFYSGVRATRNHMDFLKNVAVNLKASGSAAVMCIWCICITLLGLCGETQQAKSAMSILAFFGGMVMLSLAAKT